jgi:hypothetical protein
MQTSDEVIQAIHAHLINAVRTKAIKPWKAKVLPHTVSFTRYGVPPNLSQADICVGLMGDLLHVSAKLPGAPVQHFPINVNDAKATITAINNAVAVLFDGGIIKEPAWL